ncbi:Nup37p-like protein [Ophiocordyceps camponoti-floridani]|uniref:Nup37p-like protein n=1 Tax=Ophiocordyceps camponoti-floridani TaxID=2030778 RepID=A0A8H4QCE2_9HYPO|nr:Nup37p-like protein [Ophiocordyceps camponoti-floridani]
MTFSTAPRVRRTAQNTQLTYNLARRINDIQTYPVQSPQGATILITAHENGITLAWRGGRRFKSASERADDDKKQNGNAEDAIMIIDSDEDDNQPSAESQVDNSLSLFEEATDHDPYPEIIQTLDLALGTSVLNVAVPPMAPCAASDAPAGDGGISLAERMVFAVSCVTNDVYVVTIPLTPPLPESKSSPELATGLLAGRAGSGIWGESLLLLGGLNEHSDGLAMNLVTPTQAPGQKLPSRVRAVVAAHSRQASGLLMVWDVPLESEPKSETKRPLDPVQTETLPHPLTSMCFNPTLSTQLLTVSSRQAVGIYDLAISPFPSETDAAGSFPSQGSWLLGLNQPFAKPTAMRKPVLDATWIARGRAVFVLLADGMWGIWDVDGASPSAPGPIMASKLKTGVRGAALTSFSVSGYVEGTSYLRSITAQPKDGQSGEFAPMTPHTRRHATASLGSAAATLDRLSSVHGGIQMVALPPKGRAVADESLVLWIGSQEHVCVIPAVSKFWDSQLRRGHGGGVNLFSGAQPTKMVKLLDLSTGLLGERCCGVGLILQPRDGGGGGFRQADQEGGLPVDVLIRGETRLVVVRQGEDVSGSKIGAVVDRRRMRLFSRGQKSDAIIVHTKNDAKPSFSYNLSTARSNALRLGLVSGHADRSPTQMPIRPRVGFDFMDDLDMAADASADLSRDVEAEMLDVMGIEQMLDSMEDSRGSGRKKVFFDES